MQLTFLTAKSLASQWPKPGRPFPGGLAALLGWVQVVDYAVVRGGIPDERVWVVPDVPPQAPEADTPYLAFGIEPVLFDAPAFTEKDVDWTARSFLI